jgi:hypothetical protein
LLLLININRYILDMLCSGMNTNKQTFAVIAISSLLVITASISALTNLEVLGQQQNATNTTGATANQTGSVMQNQTTGNQTQAGGAMGGNIMASFIPSDLDPVTDSLNTAREALQNNDTTEAFNALSSVRNELFALTNDMEPGQITVLYQTLSPLQTQIDQAQDGLQRSDLPNALEALNAADSELLKLTEQIGLSGGETTGEDEESGEEDG